ncbi:hypothetical protein GGS23DRAFT_601090 [Durotheca rogersii]|uniref:uncharacterized protein n=1 Tax=Durotheca rogersii TaxID=419775 RepID=UPI0022203C26|nr:uncharacterized protein GGS23DRAFT_601090 [Durotheca rogersii]KAI5856679.1 hypothetical protein GGS23DRAFT_601090 [Durotheca rogersii]
MAVEYSPRTRSVADATRFTSNTLHAHSKAPLASPQSAGSPSSSSSSSHRASPSSGSSPSRAPGAPRPSSSTASSTASETIEERVRRLRAAHLAARRHDVSRFDRLLNASRRYFDAAHKFTVAGLVGFSGLAVFVTVYAAGDMMIYNHKRRAEFFALQKQYKADSLEAARLAYMTGRATEEQITLVEEAEAKAREAGLSLPPLLSAPRPMAPEAGAELRAAEEDARESEVEPSKKKGFAAWLFSGLKKEETAEESLGFAKTIDESQQVLKDKAKEAFERERENQRQGGALDQVGLDEKSSGGGETKKTGWW